MHAGENHSLWLHSELSEGKLRDLPQSTHSEGGSQVQSNVLPLAPTLSFLHYSRIIPSIKREPKRSSSSKQSFSFLDEEMNVGARVAWWGHSLTQRPAHSWQTPFSSPSHRRFLSKTQPTFSTVTKTLSQNKTLSNFFKSTQNYFWKRSTEVCLSWASKALSTVGQRRYAGDTGSAPIQHGKTCTWQVL